MKTQKIKILVVEDEVLLLRNLSKKITNSSDCFTVVGEAFNGKEALELAASRHPDIVFTDIRMPVMDGLELARVLYEEYPEIFIVVVSGYDDFEYARSLLAYKVQDYLLKPVSQDTLDKLLCSLIKKVRQKRNEQTSRLLRALLSGFAPPADCSEFMADFAGSAFGLFAVCLGSLHIRTPEHLLQPEYQNHSRKLWSDIAADLPFQSWFFPLDSGNAFLIVTLGSEFSVSEQAYKVYSELLDHFSPSSVTLCYNEVSGPAQLYIGCCDTQNRLTDSVIIGRSAFISTSDPEAALPPAVLPRQKADLLQTMLSSNNQQGISRFLEKLFQEWEYDCRPQQWIEKVLFQLMTLLQQNLYFSEEDYSQMYRNVFFCLETEPSLDVSSEKIITELLHWISIAQTVPSEIESVIKELDTFIRAHYTEELNIADLAEKYHFNHSYLTRIFKKQIGESPLRLINSLRIKDAKKLLLNNSLSIREISEALGFSSQHYFSRIFKEYTGLTPKEYRASGR